MTINDKKVVTYKYVTTHGSEITGDTRYQAEHNLENWIDSNTPYRGIVQFLKHVGATLYYITEDNRTYAINALKCYEIDEFENIIEYYPLDVIKED